MTNNQLAEKSVIQLLNSVKLACDNAERADNRVDHSFYYALTIALEELQERRKAERDSEPVILYRQVNPANGMKTYWAELDQEEFRHLKKYTDENAEFMTLYRHAQPAPVVPKEMTAGIAVKHWEGGRGSIESFVAGYNFYRAAMLQASAVCTCPSGDGSLRWPCPVHAGNSPAIPDGYVMVPKEATLEMIKSGASAASNGMLIPGIYKAMLAAADCSIPMISDRWIPVSEQMPEREVDVQVYCPDKKEQMVAYLERNELEGYFRFATWRTGDGIYCQPTHWMPLPAAPQEGK